MTEPKHLAKEEYGLSYTAEHVWTARAPAVLGVPQQPYVRAIQEAQRGSKAVVAFFQVEMRYSHGFDSAGVPAEGMVGQRGYTGCAESDLSNCDRSLSRKSAEAV